MTEKEAAKHLLTYSTTMGSGQTTDAQHNEAKRLGIKALEILPKYKDAYGKGWDDGAKATYEHIKMCEEEQEPCEGCISRKDLLKKCVYAPIAPVIKGDSVHYENIVFAKEIINAEPIQQEPKTGHWEETRYRSYDPQSCETYDDGMGYRCSNCANVFKITSLARYHYCPNCGAKMSEVGE